MVCEQSGPLIFGTNWMIARVSALVAGSTFSFYVFVHRRVQLPSHSLSRLLLRILHGDGAALTASEFVPPLPACGRVVNASGQTSRPSHPSRSAKGLAQLALLMTAPMHGWSASVEC